MSLTRSLTRATPGEHTREVERIRILIDHIHKQAEILQREARKLPEGAAAVVAGKADDLLRTADELLEAVGPGLSN